jgi:anaerobic selenocysteine-containing dehydrogenase
MTEIRSTICRFCHAQCPIHVEFDGDRPVKVSGVRDHPVYHGYACAKGRELPGYHYTGQRLLTSVRRSSDGTFQPVDSAMAIDEVAGRLQNLLEEHGPRSIALYIGTHGYNNLASSQTAMAWMTAIESPMVFTSVTIDQPGKAVSSALHGAWLGGNPGIHDADVWLTVGANTIVSQLGPVNAAYAFKEAVKRGMSLIVIDPRRTELAKRAAIHLQARPGTDPAILAGLIRVIISERLHDEVFIKGYSTGLDALRLAVEGFTPEYVEKRADISAERLVAAARLYAKGRRGIATVGTGPNMSGRGNLTEYLAKVLMTLCGHWLQEGDEVPNPGVLVNWPPPRAQAVDPSPAWGFGEALRVRGLTNTAAGMPTAALADEILLPGEGQVKALISLGGNPAMAWPDQLKTVRALEKLDLLVSIEPAMTGTARLSDYVIAPKLTFEQPGNTVLQEFLGVFPGWGYWTPYAQSSPVLAQPPAGADVIDDWEFFYGLARRMGLQLNVGPVCYISPDQQAEHAVVLDMENKPSTEAFWEMLLKDSPVPLAEVSQYPDGHVFDRGLLTVQAGDPDSTGRLQVADATMMGELAEVRGEDPYDAHGDFAFRLISRRLPDVLNSAWHGNEKLRQRYPYNPAFINPGDLDALDLESGTVVEISSARATIKGVLQAARDLRPGVISMSHCWGGLPGEDDDVFSLGGNTGRLSDTTEDFDPYTGIPRMSTIPVNIRAI